MKLEYVATKAIFIKPEPFDNGSGYRDIIESTINIRLTIYTLKVTENKRQLVYLDDQFIIQRHTEIFDLPQLRCGTLSSPGPIYL